jgi:hypothetical protein
VEIWTEILQHYSHFHRTTKGTATGTVEESRVEIEGKCWAFSQSTQDKDGGADAALLCLALGVVVLFVGGSATGHAAIEFSISVQYLTPEAEGANRHLEWRVWKYHYLNLVNVVDMRNGSSHRPLDLKNCGKKAKVRHWVGGTETMGIGIRSVMEFLGGCVVSSKKKPMWGYLF